MHSLAIYGHQEERYVLSPVYDGICITWLGLDEYVTQGIESYAFHVAFPMLFR